MIHHEPYPNSIPIIKDRLYWISTDAEFPYQDDIYIFNVDQTLSHESLSPNSGPLDLEKITKFVLSLNGLLKDPTFLNHKIYHFTSIDEKKRTNAALLMTAFQVIVQHKLPEEAWKPFKNLNFPLQGYTDPLSEDKSVICTVLDCLKGLQDAIRLGWYNIKRFDCRGYEHYKRPENGDFNWIIPNKLGAFSGPSIIRRNANTILKCSVDDYGRIFRKLGVKNVIRLNQKEYNVREFDKYDIKHLNLIYYATLDPSEVLIEEFISKCEEDNTPIAVHCKSGLGQTPLMIACYSIWKHKIKANSIIGWINLCRPGSFYSHQRKFLLRYEISIRVARKKETEPLSTVFEDVNAESALSMTILS